MKYSSLHTVFKKKKEGLVKEKYRCFNFISQLFYHSNTDWNSSNAVSSIFTAFLRWPKKQYLTNTISALAIQK